MYLTNKEMKVLSKLLIAKSLLLCSAKERESASEGCLCGTVAANTEITFCTESLKGAIAMKKQNSRCYPTQHWYQLKNNTQKITQALEH